MHGGDIYRNHVKLDYSVNVNPLGIPEGVKKVLLQEIDRLDQYPDMLCEELKKELSASLGIESKRLVCGNGASELIQAVCQCYRPRKTLLPVPGFVGYEKALKGVGSEIIREELREEENFVLTDRLIQRIREEKPELVILTSPSNPVGNFLEEDLFVRICDACREEKSLLLLDECFLLLSDREEQSRIPYQLDYEGLFILRAFTKSYAIPGLRLGYLVCKNEVEAEKIENQLPEWNVSTLAQSAGTAALKEKGYLEKARRVIREERDFLTMVLQMAGCKVYPSATNFLLFWDPQGRDFYERLLQKGILIRDCKETPGLKKGYYRIAVRKHDDNLEFQRVFTEVWKEGK